MPWTTGSDPYRGLAQPPDLRWSTAPGRAVITPGTRSIRTIRQEGCPLLRASGRARLTWQAKRSSVGGSTGHSARAHVGLTINSGRWGSNHVGDDANPSPRERVAMCVRERCPSGRGPVVRMMASTVLGPRRDPGYPTAATFGCGADSACRCGEGRAAPSRGRRQYRPPSSGSRASRAKVSGPCGSEPSIAVLPTERNRGTENLSTDDGSRWRRRGGARSGSRGTRRSAPGRSEACASGTRPAPSRGRSHRRASHDLPLRATCTASRRLSGDTAMAGH